jgi:hypothetical protein
MVIMANTPINFPPTLSVTQREEAALLAGWPANLVPEISSISMVEDSGPSTTINSIGAEGLLQILNHPNLDSKYAPILDPVNNFKAGYDLYKQQGFAGAWLDWEPPNAYQQFMSGAQNDLPAAENAVKASGATYVNSSGSATSGGTATAQTTSFWSAVGNAIANVIPGGTGAQAVGNVLATLLTNPVDILERGALMVFGGILVIIGLVMFMGVGNVKSGAEGAANLAGMPERRALSGAQSADKAARLELAQKNASIGERKVALKERREQRLENRGKPSIGRHSKTSPANSIANGVEEASSL